MDCFSKNIWEELDVISPSELTLSSPGSSGVYIKYQFSTQLLDTLFSYLDIENDTIYETIKGSKPDLLTLKIKDVDNALDFIFPLDEEGYKSLDEMIDEAFYNHEVLHLKLSKVK